MLYPISPVFEDRLRQHGRQFYVKADINGVEYDNTSIVDFEIENSVATEEFLFGTADISMLTIRIRTHDVIPPNAKVIPYLAMSTGDFTWANADIPWEDADFPWQGGQTSWMPLGEFYIDNREQVNDVWVFTCLDKLVFADVPYVSSLSYPAPMEDVWDEICDRLGYECDSSVVIGPYMLPVAPTGYTMRQVMAFIAGANSASVYVGKDGIVRFKRYSASDTPVFDMGMSDYIRVKQTNPVKTYTRIVATYDEEDQLTYEAGTGDDDHTLYLSNPLVTQEIVDDLLTQLDGFTYVPIEMDARGFPQLDAGDMISFQRNVSMAWLDASMTWEDADFPWDGVATYTTVILHQKFSFKGGLKMSIESPSKSEQQSEFEVDGSLTQQVNRLTQSAVRQGKLYYGVTITKEAGLTVERSDNAAKTVLNADELSFYKGGTKSLWFDVPSDSYKFSGVIEASAFVGGSILIGSNFSVNSSGHMVAVGAEFSGTISASVISGGVITGPSIAGGTITGATIQNQTASGNKVYVDSTGFHANDSSGVERITIGSTPSQGPKALITRNAAGVPQGVYIYDSETTYEGFKTGQFVTAHGAYLLIDTSGNVYLQNSTGAGIRVIGSNYPEKSDGWGGWVPI